MRRIPTYVEGLDAILDGGIPMGSVVLVCGAPGTMKTTLTYNVLHHNARRGRKGLYISLEQSRGSLWDHLEGLGYTIEGLDGKLSVLDLATLRKKIGISKGQPWTDLFRLYAHGLKNSFGYELLVLDSLDALEILAEIRNTRKHMFDFVKWLRTLECTAFLLAEMPVETAGSADFDAVTFSKHKEEYLADGIIYLRMASRADGGMQRQVRVVKMRGSRHDMNYHAFVVEDGLKVTQAMS